jgi:hypothetical protein
MHVTGVRQAGAHDRRGEPLVVDATQEHGIEPIDRQLLDGGDEHGRLGPAVITASVTWNAIDWLRRSRDTWDRHSRRDTSMEGRTLQA